LQGILIKALLIDSNGITYPIVLKAHQAKAGKGHQHNNQRNVAFGHGTKLSG
jgi:hypothetical protein